MEPLAGGRHFLLTAAAGVKPSSLVSLSVGNEQLPLQRRGSSEKFVELTLPFLLKNVDVLDLMFVDLMWLSCDFSCGDKKRCYLSQIDPTDQRKDFTQVPLGKSFSHSG